MSFVIYNKETTRLLNKKNGSPNFSSEGAAKAWLTRASTSFIRKPAEVDNKDDYLIADAEVFYATIEKYIVVQNLMSGADVRQRVNTPRCCSVASEQYWSM